MENILFFDIFGSLIGLGLVFGLIYGGVYAKSHYAKKSCPSKLDAVFAKWGFYGGIAVGIALLVFIILQWIK